MSSGRERSITFAPAYAGVHGVTLQFLLKRDKGAVQFVLYTNWQPLYITEEEDRRPINREFPHLLCRPLPADVVYHAYVHSYEGHKYISKCDILRAPGGCYYSSSGLTATKLFNILVTEGDTGVWRELEDCYQSVFEGIPTEGEVSS